MKKCLLILGGGEERDHCIDRCEAIGITPEFCAVDPETPALENIAEIARRVKASGVYSADHASTSLARSVAKALNFPAPPAMSDPEMWATFYDTLKTDAIPTTLVDPTDDGALAVASEQVKTPCWVRPVSPRNGALCYLVENKADLELRADQAANQSRCEMVALQTATAGTVLRVLGFKMGRDYIPLTMLEEVFQDGPYRISRELRLESGISASREIAALKIAHKAAFCLPKGHGLIESEIIFTEDGIKLSDMRSRYVIEPAVDALLQATLGIQLLDDALRLAAGERPKAAATQGLAGVVRWLNPPSGIVSEVSGMELASTLPGVTAIHIRTKKGKKLGHWTDESSRDCTGYVVAVAPHAERASACATAASEAINISTNRVAD